MGDFDGHPFRGNQYGQGGVTISRGDYKVSEPNAEVKGALTKMTQGQGLTSGVGRLSASERAAVQDWADRQPRVNETIHRGVWMSSAEWEKSDLWRVSRTDGYQKDVTTTERGLSSWTTDASRTAAYGHGGDVFVKFEFPPGSGVSISAHSVYPQEREVILPWDTKAQVVSATTNGGSSWVVKLERVR